MHLLYVFIGQSRYAHCLKRKQKVGDKETLNISHLTPEFCQYNSHLKQYLEMCIIEFN